MLNEKIDKLLSETLKKQDTTRLADGKLTSDIVKEKLD